MTDEMDLTPIVRSWLRDTLPPASASSHLLEAVDEQVPTIGQQRHPWPQLPHARRRSAAGGPATRSGHVSVTPANGLVRAMWSQPSTSAIGFVVGGVIMALLSGFLLAGVLGDRTEDLVPAAGASASASPSLDTTYLPGVELLTASVEPGVHRILSDGMRDLDWEAAWTPAQAELVVSDGDVWVVRDEAIQVGATGSHAFQARGDRPFRVAVRDDGSVALVEAGYELPSTWTSRPSGGATDQPLLRSGPPSRRESSGYGPYVAVGPDLVVWQRKGGTLQRHTPSGTEIFTGDDDIPEFKGNSPLVPKLTVVSPDGSVWYSLHAVPSTGSDCGGVVHYDGQASSYFLQGRGFCVSAMDVAADGRLWVLGSTSRYGAQQPGDGRDRLYVIDASRTNLDSQEKENEMDPRMSPRATAVAAMSLATAVAAATAPAVSAQDLQPTMSEFTGRLSCGVQGPSSPAVSWRFSVLDVSDERFDGSYIEQLAGYEDGDPDVDGIGAYSTLWEITNEGGAWVGQTASFRFAPESYSTFTVKLDGQGGYEGLTAVMEGDFTEDCGFDIRGVVVDGDLPATPVAVLTTE